MDVYGRVIKLNLTQFKNKNNSKKYLFIYNIFMLYISKIGEKGNAINTKLYINISLHVDLYK